MTNELDRMLLLAWPGWMGDECAILEAYGPAMAVFGRAA
jgi:hypothetical protein